MSGENKLQCYNRSCGQVFDPSVNTSESCLHHPGVPVFHDAYKKWSCCDKKTTDFTDFLNFEGCTRSYHSNVKPPEPKKPTKKEIEITCPTPLEKKKSLQRPDPDAPLVRLTHVVGASLKPLLEKMMKEISLEPRADIDSGIKRNTPCHNNTCQAVYKGELSDTETCLYHAGVAVFHEGMKYWSCCVKRTTDFDNFLSQVGCTTGKHKWLKDKDGSVESKCKCRYDWHQTGSAVIISVYSKCPLPERSFVEASPVRLRLHIVFGSDEQVFEEELMLFGIVDVGQSRVSFLGSKVEIELRKAEPMAWKDLATKNSL